MPEAAGKKVLVADDEDGLLELISSALAEAGYWVETARDGLSALEKVRSFQPDLLLLDVIMPKENGYRVSRQIKTHEDEFPGAMPKVLLVTGRRLDDDPERERLFLEFSHADGILYKPFELGDLLSKVEVLIGQAAPPAPR